MKREELMTILGDTPTWNNFFLTFQWRDPRKRVTRAG